MRVLSLPIKAPARLLYFNRENLPLKNSLLGMCPVWARNLLGKRVVYEAVPQDQTLSDDRHPTPSSFAPLRSLLAAASRYNALAVALAILALITTFPRMFAKDGMNSMENSLALTSFVVGPRSLPPPYYGRGCSSSEFLEAIARIKVTPNGTAQVLPPDFSFSPPDFDFSFTFPTTCPPPHVFTAEEACDLISALGGIYLRGDSLMRMVANALFMLLTGRKDGATRTGSEVCVGDTMFDDRTLCRNDARWSTLQEIPNSIYKVCGKATLHYSEAQECPVHPLTLQAFQNWYDQELPLRTKQASTVVIQSYALHCHMLRSIPIFGAVKPMLRFASTLFPQPILLWFSIHAPGVNKPEHLLEEQGPEQVKKYNQEIAAALRHEKPGGVLDGAMGIVDWYPMTDGARTSDGTHYAYQINMEKAHLLLNYLDIIWGEVAAAGGEFDINSLCPPGIDSYRCSRLLG